MADNVTIPTTGTGTATPVIATDDVASVHYQKVKIALGADGAIDTLWDSGQQLSANSAPVVLASDHSDIKITLDGEQVVISGTVQVQSNSANLATQATAAAIQTAVELIDNAISGSEMQVDLVAGGPIGATTDAEAAADGSVIAILKRLRTLLSGTLTATISGTVAVTQSGTWDEVGVNDSGNSLTVDAPVTTPVFVRLSDGVDPITTLPVSLASVPSHAVTNAGTFAVQESGAALTALQLIDNLVLAEDAAHGSGDPGVQALAVRKDSGAAIAGTDGDYSPLQVDASGNLRVNVAAGGAGDGAILDGVSSSIKATVLDYTGSNPLAVRLTDTNGDYVGAGAGTQYTEDAPAAANPVGTALILVREDARAGSLTSADGDNVAARGNNKGELYTKDTDAAELLTLALSDTGNIATATNLLVNTLSSVALDSIRVSDAGGSLTVDNGGTFVTQENGAALTALQVMDDWDETDRAKVNVIVGQAGITAGAGAAAANTPRVTLASDDPAVAQLVTANAYLDGLAGGQMPAYLEDAAAPGNPNGGALALVRDDSLAGSLTTANGDIVMARGNNKGEQYTKDTDAAAILTTIDDDTGNIRTNVTLLATTPHAEDTGHISGDYGVMSLAVRQDADTSLVSADGDYAPLQVNANGALKVEIFDGGDSHTIDGTVTANLAAGTNNIGDVDVASIAAGDNNIGNVDIVTVPAPLSTTGGGTEATALRVTVASDSTGVLSVDDNGASLTVDAPVGTPVFVRLSDGAAAITTLPVSLASVPSHAVTNAGTFAVQAASAGDVAHDGGDSGNPVKVGSVAYNFDGTVPGTAVAEGDRANQVADVYGRQYVEITHPNYWSVSADYASAQTNTSVKAAPGAGLKLYITDIFLSNGATAGNVTLLDGSGGTVKWEAYPGVNGGAAPSFRTPIALTANTALCITSTTVTTHSVTICGFTAAQ